MSIDAPAVIVGDVAQAAGAAEPAKSLPVEAAVAIGFTVIAVLFVSFVAVVTALV